MRSLYITSIDSFSRKEYNPSLDSDSKPEGPDSHKAVAPLRPPQPSGNKVQHTTTCRAYQPKHLHRYKHLVNLHSNPFKQNHSSSEFHNQFSERTRLLVQHAISNCWATSTVNKYSNTIRLFLKFCDLERIPKRLRFPTDEFVLCAFAASGAGNSSYKTIRSKIAALKAWHHRHGVEWKGNMRLHLVLNGVKHLAPQSSTKTPRPPISALMLNQLINHLDLSDSLDSAVAACATVAFWGQCRLGELLPTSLQNFSTTAVPSRSNIRQSTRNTHSYLLFLPQTKTNCNGEDVVLTRQSGECDPLKTLQNHFNINRLSRKLPLFAYNTTSGPRTLTRHRFLARCNSIWSKLGYPRTTGHSFRIGGTTELLLAGVPPDVVKTLGRWSSDSFLRYWRFLEDIAPRYSRKINYRPNLKRKRRTHS